MRKRPTALLVLALCQAFALFAGAPSAQAQQGGIGVHHGLPRPLLDLPAFRLDPIEALFVGQPFESYVEQWSAATRARLAAAPRNRLLQQRFAGAEPALPPDAVASIDDVPVTASLPLPSAPTAAAAAAITAADSVSFLPPPPAVLVFDTTDMLTGAIGEYADLGMKVTGTGNLGGAWTRYKPCDPAVNFNCNPGIMPELKPDVQFGLRVGGTISQRVHVDVDYDQTREFDAANNINVYYQGLTDEVLQRVEVGDVSIRLPSSRYMTRGVPAGNFGFMASGQLGPLELQTVFAQQKGDLTTKEFKFGGGARGTSGVQQDAELVVDDADYVKGQFFFLVPPSELLGFPHINALDLLHTAAAASVRPGIGGSIQLFRDERLPVQSGNAQLGYFLAEALPPGTGVRHTGSFRRLIPEQDYIVHTSGLWIMLRAPLRPDEALAAAFVTETGDTIGQLNPESSPPGTTPRLRLLRSPYATHQPGSGTWPMEMHQVYRLDSSGDVDVSQVELKISLGGVEGGRTFRNVLGEQLSLLKFFGLDEDSPVDRIDAAQVFQPARDGFSSGAGSPIGGTYIVFPTLRPFVEPAPVESERLSAEDLRQALGPDANAAIYEDTDPVSRDASGRFRLNFRYRVKLDGVVNQFSLGAFGLREGSERLFIGNRQLVRDVDYSIDYEIGTITLKDATNLFATSPGAEIRATWEQKPMFSIAPTSVFGATARYDLGTRGELNFSGLFQAEKSLMTRPQLGVEPGSAFIGGASGRFQIGGGVLDHLLSDVLGLRSARPSAITVTGEMAFTMPNDNRLGVAYLDDFEATDEVGLSVERHLWKLGSVPQSTEGDRGTLPFVLDAASAAPLVWQHDFMHNGSVQGALLPRTMIDNQINIIGKELPEPVMWLSFGGAPAAPSLPPPSDDRRWRSMTTVLSTTGRDMTRSEYLEFYVSAGANEPLALIFDIGTVSEDAFYIDSLGSTTGTYEDDGRRWGTGVLDEEARLVDREVWGTDKDRRGLWDQACLTQPLVSYAVGDPRINCTRGNGRQDTEDLNGNGILDGDDGQYFRYVVQLDQMSEYLVRDTAATGTGYRLYRIPLRSGTAVNGANDGTWRFVRHLRMTVAGEPSTLRVISLARIRVVGSRWTKRDVHGVRRGMLDDDAGMSAQTADVRVGPVSRLTDGGLYYEPPGVEELAQDRTQEFGSDGQEINTKSLRLAYTGLEAGDRAEIYYRYPQQARNMLAYGELRLWVLPRAGDWGEQGGERFTVRIGTDPRNFYLYQSKLRPATGPRAASPADWLPELVIDVRRWQDLKAEAERRQIERGPLSAGIDTVWSADSTYAIVLEDRARAPNLAAVREITFAVYNAGMVATTGEVWIDELRVAQPDREPGAAGNISVDMNAGDVVSANITVANLGSQFRQLNQNATYMGTRELSMAADTRLEKLLPAGWGIDLPLTVSHARSEQAPQYLQQSDVRAADLEGLRDAGSRSTRVGLRISKRTPTANPLLSLLIDGSALRLSYVTSDYRSITSRDNSGGFTGDYSYSRTLVHRDVAAVPGLLAAALRVLAPETIENSEAFSRVVSSRLRWSPASISFGGTFNDEMRRSYRYDRILTFAADSLVLPTVSPRERLTSDVQVGFQPFSQLTGALSLSMDRDLLASDRASTQRLEQMALRDARTALGGFDMGWETGRVLGTTVSYRPQITSWLRLNYSYNNRFMTDRNPSYLELHVNGADTTASMQRRFESTRQTTSGVTLQPRALVDAMRLDSAGLAPRLLRGVLGRLEPFDVTWRNTLSSQFDRESFTPGYGYQIGIGSLDDFTFIGADTAARAQQRGTFTLSSGMELARGMLLNVGYSSSDVLSFDARGGDRVQREVGWPKATLHVRDLRIPEVLGRFMTSFSTSAGVERIVRRAEFAGAEQQRGGTEIRFPVSLTVGLPRAFTALYSGSFSLGETLDPTGNSESGGYQQNLAITGVVQPPETWRARLNGPITISLRYMDQQQKQCRYNPTLAELDGCIAFLDVGTRTGTIEIGSMLSDIRVGMMLNYIGRNNHVGIRNGSNEFQFGLHGTFDFAAGQLPARFR